jgi:glucan endo-1,3-beta-D-glucosidase
LLPTTGPFPGFPIPSQPRGLSSPFVAPYVIVPIDSSDPNAVIGNQFTAQISPTRSTLFSFNIQPEPGKSTCNLVFALPLLSNPSYVAPYIMLSSGGIGVSRLVGPADGRVSLNSVSGSTLVGNVPRLTPGNKYTLASAPCETGQTVGYRIDSAGGLDLQFFQMISPALGLFMEVV